MDEYRITLRVVTKRSPLSNFSINPQAVRKKKKKRKTLHLMLLNNCTSDECPIASDFSPEKPPKRKKKLKFHLIRSILASLSFHIVLPRADPSIRHTTHKHIICFCFFLSSSVDYMLGAQCFKTKWKEKRRKKSL